MMASGTDPGLITRIDKGWMFVKVPVGTGCRACPGKSQCTFSGPERAYRTFRIRQVPECHVGDRILVDVPDGALAIAGIVFIAVPVLMILGGYWLLISWLPFPHAMPLLWLSGLSIWLVSMYVVNRWMERSARFSERITPIGRAPK